MRGFRAALVGIAAVASSFGLAGTASAVNIGTSVGELIVNYNPTSPEVPANVSYVSTGTNVFNFNPALVGAGPAGYGPTHFFQAVANQFKFDLEYEVQANSAPGIVAVDGNPLGGTGTTAVDWAITANQFPVNSPFYGGTGTGSAINIYQQTVTQSGTVFTMNLAGELSTDGFIHWATSGGSTPPAGTTGTSPISPVWDALFPNGKIYFQGTLTYDSSQDTSIGADVYTGTINFESALPLPTAVPMGAVLIGGLALGARRRSSMFAGA